MSTEVVINNPSQMRPYRNLMTLQTALLAVGVGGAGIILLYLGGRNSLWKHHQGMQALVNDLGAALVVSVALALLWELVGKRAFTREILEIAQTSADVNTAGLARIGINYVADPDWESLFSGVEKLDIFVSYGRTWRNTHLSRLKDVANNPKARIQVFLPDPEDVNTVTILADRFSMSNDDLIAAIREAKSVFLALREPGGGEVKVFYRKGDSVFSCYRFDNYAVVTLYTHSRERGQVPTIVCRNGGTLYDFVRKELRAIQAQSGDSEIS
jgi:hypothetical protein